MKIAVTYENGEVFQHFGRTQQLKVYNVEDSKVVSSEVVSCNGACHSGVGAVIQQIGADVLLCGGMGSCACNMMVNMGVTYVTGLSGSADAAVEMYLRGELGNNPNAGVHECHGH